MEARGAVLGIQSLSVISGKEVEKVKVKALRAGTEKEKLQNYQPMWCHHTVLALWLCGSFYTTRVNQYLSALPTRNLGHFPVLQGLVMSPFKLTSQSP